MSQSLYTNIVNHINSAELIKDAKAFKPILHLTKYLLEEDGKDLVHTNKDAYFVNRIIKHKRSCLRFFGNKDSDKLIFLFYINSLDSEALKLIFFLNTGFKDYYLDDKHIIDLSKIKHIYACFRIKEEQIESYILRDKQVIHTLEATTSRDALASSEYIDEDIQRDNENEIGYRKTNLKCYEWLRTKI